VAHRGGSLRSISLVGNSLGGLYARHAAAELWDAQSGRIAGLEPDAFVSVGCPHLGVRQFTFLPLPPPLVRLGPAPPLRCTARSKPVGSPSGPNGSNASSSQL